MAEARVNYVNCMQQLEGEEAEEESIKTHPTLSSLSLSAFFPFLNSHHPSSPPPLLGAIDDAREGLGTSSASAAFASRYVHHADPLVVMISARLAVMHLLAAWFEVFGVTYAIRVSSGHCVVGRERGSFLLQVAALPTDKSIIQDRSAMRKPPFLPSPFALLLCFLFLVLLRGWVRARGLRDHFHNLILFPLMASS